MDIQAWMNTTFTSPVIHIMITRNLYDGYVIEPLSSIGLFDSSTPDYRECKHQSDSLLQEVSFTSTS